MSITYLKTHGTATIDRKDAVTSQAVEYDLKEEEEVQSNNVTSSRTKTQTPQQSSSSSNFVWSWTIGLPAFICIILLAYFVQQKLDQISQLQINNTACNIESQNLKEKEAVLKSEATQLKESLSAAQKEKDELRESEFQCRLDMINAEIKHTQERYDAKEEYRVDIEQKRRSEQEIQESEIQILKERFAWLIECLRGQNTVQDDFIILRVIRAFSRATEGGLGVNSDVENCLKMVNSPFQRRLPA